MEPIGSILKIFKYPHKILSKDAQTVENFDQELKDLAQNMLFTMYNAPGIGLAGPQVGQSIRMFVIDIDYKREKFINSLGEDEYQLSGFNPRIFINPIITTFEGEITYEEGCLSLPGVYEEVTRPQSIEVTYFDLEGMEHTESFEELPAICIQHENDHLNGTVFIDHLSLLKKNMIKKRIIKQKRTL